jgi:hypothetical protein
MTQLLKEYDPIVLTGKVDKKTRAKLIREFQESDNKRVIIANTAVGGQSISLHDTKGPRTLPDGRYIDPRRHLNVMPSYKLIDLEQASGRSYRFGTKTDVEVDFTYGEEGAILIPVFESLARKAKCLRLFTDNNGRKRTILPGEYPSYNLELDGKLVLVKEGNEPTNDVDVEVDEE